MAVFRIEKTRDYTVMSNHHPFPVSLFRDRRQHLDKESPLGGQRRSIRQTDTFLFVPSHMAGAP